MSTIWEVDDADEEIEGLDASGRPDPAYAAALGLIPASYGRRTLGVAIDFAFWLLVQVPFWVFSFPLLLMYLRSQLTLYGFVEHPRFLLAAIMAGISLLLMLALLIVQGVFQGRAGVTIGKAIVGIRAINVARLAKPGFLRIVLRTLIISGAGIVPIIGPLVFFLSALRDPEKRGRAWHDYASQVWLVDVKKGLNPYDGKRMRIARKVVKVEIAPQVLALPSLATVEGMELQPGYRPAHSVSAGVLGVAKPKHTDRDDAVGVVARHLSAAPLPQRPEKDGTPVVGGYLADRRPPAQGAEDGAPASAAEADRLLLAVPGDIISSSSVPDAPHPPASAPPASAPPAASAPAPEPQPQFATRLTLDSGDEYVLTEPTVFGRNPDAIPPYGEAHCVPIPDETRSVSKTHFALRPVSAGVEVQDLGSTNGTSIVRGTVERHVSGEVVLVAEIGDVVRFGDRAITIGSV